MQSPTSLAAQIAQKVALRPIAKRRTLIALAGPPASGKSTVSAALLDALNADGARTGLLAMDGYHLDNAILDARDLRARKGAPETFDFAGLYATLERLQNEDEVIVPTFDRARDLSLGASAVIDKGMRTVVVEGNYLLLNELPWANLNAFWDFSVLIKAEQNVLEQRLLQRWLDHGFTAEQARTKALENDIPNALRVLNGSRAPDMTIKS